MHPEPPSPPTSISAPIAAFVQSGLSVTVAGRGERLVPSIAKAVGCRVGDDGRTLSVLVFAGMADAVCRDIACNGQVAVCLHRPSTSETIQLKGTDAHSVPASPAELAAARRCLDLFIEELDPLGFRRPLLETALWRDPADLLAIRFTIAGGFTQTPGAGAGAPLAL